MIAPKGRVYKPVRDREPPGHRGESCCMRAAPRVAQIAMNSSFRMFPDCAAAKGDKNRRSTQPTPEAIAMQQMMRGIHF